MDTDVSSLSAICFSRWMMEKQLGPQLPIAQATSLHRILDRREVQRNRTLRLGYGSALVTEDSRVLSVDRTMTGRENEFVYYQSENVVVCSPKETERRCASDSSSPKRPTLGAIREEAARDTGISQSTGESLAQALV